MINNLLSVLLFFVMLLVFKLNRLVLILLLYLKLVIQFYIKAINLSQKAFPLLFKVTNHCLLIEIYETYTVLMLCKK